QRAGVARRRRHARARGLRRPVRHADPRREQVKSAYVVSGFSRTVYVASGFSRTVYVASGFSRTVYVASGFSRTVYVASGFSRTSLPHANISLQLQIDERRHRPQIDRDVGVDLLRIDLPGEEPLPADPDVDAGLLQRVDDRDVGVVAVVALPVRLV